MIDFNNNPFGLRFVTLIVISFYLYVNRQGTARLACQTSLPVASFIRNFLLRECSIFGFNLLSFISFGDTTPGSKLLVVRLQLSCILYNLFLSISRIYSFTKLYRFPSSCWMLLLGVLHILLPTVVKHGYLAGNL